MSRRPPTLGCALVKYAAEMQAIAIIVVLWLLGVAGIVGFAFRRPLSRLWSEPVLSRPVLIIESDDWGAGPLSQAESLDALCRTLIKYQSRAGRRPVMTLGIVLAVADTARMTQDEAGEYHRLTLSAPQFSEVLASIRRGVDAGVFSLHLHGMEHYWPGTLLSVAQRDASVRSWLTKTGVPLTEDLPSHLQSRWVDASRLPSRTLPQDDMASAVAQEVATFTAIFEEPPTVVVPPTFVWNDVVEAAWAAQGIRTIVTPGRRYVGRGADGGLVPDSQECHNGAVGASGVAYVVRNAYFEPALGHRVERAIDALRRSASAGRPTLIETHRFNFVGEASLVRQSLAELERLLAAALAAFPEIVFMSTKELAVAIKDRDPALIERRTAARIRAWLIRLTEVPRLKKIAWWTGLIVPCWFLYRMVCETGHAARRTDVGARAGY